MMITQPTTELIPLNDGTPAFPRYKTTSQHSSCPAIAPGLQAVSLALAFRRDSGKADPDPYRVKSGATDYSKGIIPRFAPLAQWLGHQTSIERGSVNLGIAGSSPAWGFFYFRILLG